MPRHPRPRGMRSRGVVNGGREPAPAALGYAAQRLGRPDRRRRDRIRKGALAPQRPARSALRRSCGKPTLRLRRKPGPECGAGPDRNRRVGRRATGTYSSLRWPLGVPLPAVRQCRSPPTPPHPDAGRGRVRDAEPLSRAGEGQAACASQAKGVRAPRFRMGRDGPVSWLGVSQPSRPEGRCLTNRDHRATPDHVRGRRPVMTSGWDAPFPAPSSIGHGTAAPKGQALATDR
jgi:hypothetical protein